MFSSNRNRSSNIPTGLEAMPVEVVWEILAQSSFNEIINLRRVSSNYKVIVDKFLSFNSTLNQLSFQDLLSLRSISHDYKIKVNNYLLSKLNPTEEEREFCLRLTKDATITQLLEKSLDSDNIQMVDKALMETINLHDITSIDPVLLAKAIIKKATAENTFKRDLDTTPYSCLPYMIMLYAIFITKAKTMSEEEYEKFKSEFGEQIEPLLDNYYDCNLVTLWNGAVSKDYINLLRSQFTRLVNRYEAFSESATKNLYNINLAGADLNKEDLSQVICMRKVNLENANLSGVNWQNSVVKASNLSHANLKNANFVNSRVVNIKVTRSNLNNVDVRFAYVDGHEFSTADWLNTPFVSKFFTDTVRNEGRAGFKKILDTFYVNQVESLRHPTTQEDKKKLQETRDYLLQFIINKLKELKIGPHEALQMMEDYRKHKISGLNSQKPKLMWASERKKMDKVFHDFIKELKEEKSKEEKTKSSYSKSLGG